jgi:hypothetical protein
LLTPPERPMNPWQIEASGHARRISTAQELGDDSARVSIQNARREDSERSSKRETISPANEVPSKKTVYRATNGSEEDRIKDAAQNRQPASENRPYQKHTEHPRAKPEDSCLQYKPGPSILHLV